MMKITPTGWFAGYIIMLGLSVLPAVLVNSPVGYLPVLVLLFFGVLSVLQLYVVKKKLHIGSTALTGQRIRGDTAEFTIELENAGIFPIPNFYIRFYIQSIQGADRHAYPLYLTMSPREKRSFGLEADFSHIGIFETGFEQIVIYDLLGIFKVDCPVGTPGRVEVLPRQYQFFEFPLSDKMLAESNAARTPTPALGSDYSGVREYVYGDPMKTIQWKLSAHALTLMTKQMETYTNLGMAAVLDFRMPDYEEDVRLSLFDSVIEVGAALGEYAARNEMDFELMFFGRAGKRRELPLGAKDFRTFLDELHAASGTDAKTPARILQEDCRRAYGQPNVVFCTAKAEEETFQALAALKRCGKNPMLLLLLPDTLSDQERAEQMGVLSVLQKENIGVLVAASAEGMVKA